MTEEDHILRIARILKDTAGEINQYQRAQKLWDEFIKIQEEEIRVNELMEFTKYE
jgi:cell fate (sporulation/competence/biofilm development) regulator YlbF (YheA/YmcA/DUF963 family)